MNIPIHLDLFFVGIVVITTCVFGFAVYFSNTKSITNRIFLLFSLVTALWGVANYLVYQIAKPEYVLWVIRFSVFLATFHAFLLYEMFLIFPSDNYHFSKKNKFILIPMTIFVALLTLTPLVFFEIEPTSQGISGLTVGMGVLFFVLLTFCLAIMAFVNLIKKIRHEKSLNARSPLIIILIGFIISFSMILVLAMIVPVFFNYTGFNKYSALMIFPFIALTAYSILRHKLLNIKSIPVLILICFLLLFTLFEAISSNNTNELLLSSGLVFIEIILSIFLLKIVIGGEHQKVEIERVVEQLKNLDELKSKFMSLARHQIGTPLTAVKGYVSLLDDGIYGEVPLEMKPTLVTIQRLVDKFVHIIKDFIDVTKLEQQEVKYNFVECDLHQLICEIVKEYNVSMLERGLKVKYSFNHDVVFTVNADKEKLKQALVNVFENIFKFARNGSVLIELFYDFKAFTLKITDNNHRILPAVNSKLISKLTHSGDEYEASIVGNDLGLYVAKKYIEAHGGNFQVSPSIHGRGTTFSINLNINSHHNNL
ncbi:hypothetical protein KW782_00455 [Candidatus Parcubacteria bacterium]|nr:hypothetical protein [Candidatus Parcubacteria bacterium]